MRTTPEQVRLILIDKQVEMGRYNRLRTCPAGDQPEGGQHAWAVKESTALSVLTEVGFRDITGYNAAYDRGGLVDDTVDPPVVDAEETDRGGADAAEVRAVAAHRGRGRRVERLDDGGRPRCGGQASPASPRLTWGSTSSSPPSAPASTSSPA